jgi:hypothetical protein
MPLQTQQLAGFEQKRTAFLSFIEKGNHRCSGYTTRVGAPVYLLGECAYPFVRTTSKDDSWHTFLLLPPPLVSDDDVGITDTAPPSRPQFEVPLEVNFFLQTLGPELLGTVNGGQKSVISTVDALRNTRLVALYFSAHWCG